MVCWAIIDRLLYWTAAAVTFFKLAKRRAMIGARDTADAVCAPPELLIMQ
jgi:hypothetical protein